MQIRNVESIKTSHFNYTEIVVNQYTEIACEILYRIKGISSDVLSVC